MGGRRHELDWLRVLAVLLLIYFHSARVFDYGDFYVKNRTLNVGMEVFVAIVSSWFMPLFFFIAGAAAVFALGKRSGRQFLSERAKRLGIPFVFGLVVISSWQVYIVYIQKPGNTASVLSFWKYLFSVPPLTEIVAGKVGNEALINAFTWEPAHLWFILYLLVFSLVALPLFKSMKEGRMAGSLDRLAALCERKSWGIYLLAIPMALANLSIGLDLSIARLFLIVPFLLGFVVYSDDRFGRAVERRRWWSLGSTVVLTAALVVVVAVFEEGASGVVVMLVGAVIGAVAWLWILTFLGAARACLNRTNAFLEYANEGSYPFYILHQTVIVLLAFEIVKPDMPLMLKYAILTTSALVITVVVYDLLVRRWRPTRFLFGMRPGSPRAVEPGVQDSAP